MRLGRLLVAAPTAACALLLALPWLLLGLPFLVVGVGTRVVRRLLAPRPQPWPQLIEFTPTFGWKPRAHLRAYHLADDLFWTTTDAEGWRGTATLEESRLVVFGDSFAWGYGIDDWDFFANLNPQLPIKAIGANGYNMVQELLWMQRYAPRLRGKLVVWFIYHGNDLFENLMPHMRHYRMPFVRERNGCGQWEIVTWHVRPEPWPFAAPFRPVGQVYYERLAELCSPTYLAQRAYAACAFLLRQGRDCCQAAGARLAVVTIPDVIQLHPQGIARLKRLSPEPEQCDPDYPDQRLRQICDDLEIPFVALKDHLTLAHHKKHDSHWNARGHWQVSRILTDLYDKLMQPAAASRVAG